MTPILKRVLMGSLLALATGAVTPLAADTMLEQGPEHRFQLDFHVPDAALQKMLPSGWVPLVATMGPAKDANIRMIFIDRINVMGSDGKPVGRGSSRLAYLAVPVKQSAGEATGQIIIAGLTDNAADAPGPFGVYQYAPNAKMTRTVSASGGTAIGE